MKTNDKPVWSLLSPTEGGSLKLIKQGLLPEYLLTMWAENNGGKTPVQIKRRTTMWIVIVCALMTCVGVVLSRQYPDAKGTIYGVIAYFSFIFAAISIIKCRVRLTTKFHRPLYDLLLSLLSEVTVFSFPQSQWGFTVLLDERLSQLAYEAQRKRGGLATYDDSFNRPFDGAKMLGALRDQDGGFEQYFNPAKERVIRESVENGDWLI